MASLDWIQAKRSTKAENWAAGGLGGLWARPGNRSRCRSLTCSMQLNCACSRIMMICNTSGNLDTVEIGIGGFAQMIGHGIGYGTEREKKMAMCSNILRAEKGDEGQNLMGVVSGTKSESAAR